VLSSLDAHDKAIAGMSQQRALLCGYYGCGNAGDEALLAALLQMLPAGISPIALSGNPAQTRDRFGIASYPGRSAGSVLRALRSSDWFIWGGGSLMQDATSWRNPLYYGGLMALAQQQGLGTIAWAQGIGPLQQPLTRWVARRALAGCDAISVRDSASAQWLEQWGLPVHLAPDPVWALEAPAVAEAAALPVPWVAVTLRAHPQLTQRRLATLAAALQQFQHATQAYLAFIPFQPERDRAIAQAAAAELDGPYSILTLSDPVAFKGAFCGSEMAISMRFHGLIAAAAAGCRCFAIGYDPKVRQLQQDLTLPGWSLAQLPADADAIARAWIAHYREGYPLPLEQRQALSERARQHQALLAAALQPSGRQ